MCDGIQTDRMTKNSQHGTQKPSALYALGLKKEKYNMANKLGYRKAYIKFMNDLFCV